MHIKYLNAFNESTSHVYPNILFRKSIVEFIDSASACSLYSTVQAAFFTSQYTGLCLQKIFPSAVVNPLIHSDETLRWYDVIILLPGTVALNNSISGLLREQKVIYCAVRLTGNPTNKWGSTILIIQSFVLTPTWLLWYKSWANSCCSFLLFPG